MYLEVAGFTISKAWMTEVGLVLDMLAFSLLSLDLVRAMREERISREELQRLERMAFNYRYGFFAPGKDVQDQQQAEFDKKQAARKSDAEREMRKRRYIAYTAIGLAIVGLVMQIIGGYPTA